MSIKIQEGRRYVMRYGGITGVMRRRTESCFYPWTDGCLTWAEDGHWFDNGCDNPGDIIAEYTPQPEPLTCTLRAGGKYETVTPSGEAGPIVTLAGSIDGYSREWQKLFPFTARRDGYTHVVSPDGLISHSVDHSKLGGYRIVREHVPQPTPIERLETLVGKMKETPTPLGIVVLPKEFVAEIDSALTDLKATVKP
jgi:hypothetical protein